jgi:hypothetical protein
MSLQIDGQNNIPKSQGPTDTQSEDSLDISDQDARAMNVPVSKLMFTRKRSFLDGLMAPDIVLGDINDEFHRQVSTSGSQMDES